jgi:hypothetical protein
MRPAPVQQSVSSVFWLGAFPPTMRTRQSLPIRLPYEFATSVNSRVIRGHLETNALNFTGLLDGHYGRAENFSFRSGNKLDFIQSGCVTNRISQAFEQRAWDFYRLSAGS